MLDVILSIIIPMYQSQEFIKKCLDSMQLDRVKMQELEILVVDDGSRDDGAVLVKEYVRRYPDLVRLLEKENGGHGSAVNLGVAQCRGRFFKVVDADDWLLADGLYRMLELLQ